MEQTIAHDYIRLDYIRLMMHCIGLDQQKPYISHGKQFYHPYRNRFVTRADNEKWAKIEAAGYATHEDVPDSKYATFSLTRAGLDFLGRHLHIHIYDETE